MPSGKDVRVTLHPNDTDEKGVDPHTIQTKMHGLQPSSDLAGAGETVEFSLTNTQGPAPMSHTSEGNIPGYVPTPLPDHKEPKHQEPLNEPGENMLDIDKQRDVARQRDLKARAIKK